MYFPPFSILRVAYFSTIYKQYDKLVVEQLCPLVRQAAESESIRRELNRQFGPGSRRGSCVNLISAVNSSSAALSNIGGGGGSAPVLNHCQSAKQLFPTEGGPGGGGGGMADTKSG